MFIFDTNHPEKAIVKQKLPHTHDICLFTDASTSPQRTVAVGGFVFFDEKEVESLAVYHAGKLRVFCINNIMYKEYQTKQSTWAEISTVIEALQFLKENAPMHRNVKIYTDCQSLCGLLGQRKEKLIRTNFKTRSGKPLSNANLYQTLFAIAQCFNIEVFKLKGHQPRSHALSIEEKIFTILDKSTRKKLRSLLSK